MGEEIKKIGEVGLNTTIIDPFSKNCITSVFVSITKSERRGVEYWHCYGIVEFTSGNTSGKQRFDGDSFDDVALKIRNFINNEL